MRVIEAINASVVNAAEIEYRNMYTVVDGSLDDGTYTVKTGVQGMPPTEHIPCADLDEAVKVVQGKDMDNNDWAAIGEQN